MSGSVSTRNLRWLRESNLTVLTRAEAARVLGVDPRTVTRGIEAGDLPSLKIGRRVVVPRLALLALLDPEAARTA